jgi:predicted dehydrogenase
MDAFVEMAAGERPNPVPADAARAALAVALAAERSRLESRPVPVAEIC